VNAGFRTSSVLRRKSRAAERKLKGVGRRKNRKVWAIAAVLLLRGGLAFGDGVRHIGLEEAVRLALQQNRALKIARLKVKENESRKSEARSDYFPTLTNQSNLWHISELQDIAVPAGSLGTVNGATLPQQTVVIRQGQDTLYSSGTQLTQPVTQLLRVHQENRAAAADIGNARDDLKTAENEVALQVHTLYFGILVAQLQKKAAEQESSFAAEALRESENDVQNGSALQVTAIQNRAELLQGQQSALTADLQIQDYMTELNDLLGLPLDTKLELDAQMANDFQTLTKDEYVKAAWEANPEIHAAQQVVEKARAGVSAAKTAYIPDVTAFARYSYQDGVPFFVRNFGTVGINLNYTLWDFGKRRATVNERATQLAEAEQNVERLRERVAVDVERGYNKLERTKSMVNVAAEVAKLREESERLETNQAAQGAALAADVRRAAAANYKAKADLLQAQLGYLLAYAELERTVGRVPGLEKP
jgi:outer membrane protein TolC